MNKHNTGWDYTYDGGPAAAALTSNEGTGVISSRHSGASKLTAPAHKTTSVKAAPAKTKTGPATGKATSVKHNAKTKSVGHINSK
jgi:hypothetical protein